MKRLLVILSVVPNLLLSQEIEKPMTVGINFSQGGSISSNFAYDNYRVPGAMFKYHTKKVNYRAGVNIFVGEYTTEPGGSFTQSYKISETILQIGLEKKLISYKKLYIFGGIDVGLSSGKSNYSFSGGIIAQTTVSNSTFNSLLLLPHLTAQLYANKTFSVSAESRVYIFTTRSKMNKTTNGVSSFENRTISPNYRGQLLSGLYLNIHF
jgi:hypothetical protein